MSFSDALIGFPIKSILRNAFKLTPRPSAAFWIQEDRISALFSRERLPVTSEQMKAAQGAPLLFAPVAQKSPFANEVLKPNRLEQDGRFAFVVEHPDSIISLVQTKNLSIRSIEELSSLPMETLLPTSALPDSFCWRLFCPELKPLPSRGALPPSVVVVGLPQKICWWAEKWVEAVDGILLCVCPGLLAILQWCRMRTPGFALIPRKGQSYLAVFFEQRLHLLSKLPSEELLNALSVEALVYEIQRELQIPDSPLCIYPGDPSNTSITPLLSGFQGPIRVLGPQSSFSIQTPDAEKAVLRDLIQRAQI